MVSPFTIGPSMPAPVDTVWLSSHARRECFALQFFEQHFIFDWMWGVEGVGENLSDRLHSLRATMVCTGYYAVVLVALLLTGSFMIQLIMCAAMRDLPMHTTDDVGYAKI